MSFLCVSLRSLIHSVLADNYFHVIVFPCVVESLVFMKSVTHETHYGVFYGVLFYCALFCLYVDLHYYYVGII